MGAALTELTVAGRTLTVRGEYDEVAALLKPRTLTADNGFREIVTAAGERKTIAVGAVALVEAAAGGDGGYAERIGFRRGGTA